MDWNYIHIVLQSQNLAKVFFFSFLTCHLDINSPPPVCKNVLKIAISPLKMLEKFYVVISKPRISLAF